MSMDETNEPLFEYSLWLIPKIVSPFCSKVLASRKEERDAFLVNRDVPGFYVPRHTE